MEKVTANFIMSPSASLHRTMQLPPGGFL